MKLLILVISTIIPLLSFSQQDIFEAARNGDTVSIKKIIQITPQSINSLNEHQHTPLILAAYHNKPSTVLFLIKNGAKINYNSNQGNALHGVAYKGYSEIANILIENGCNVNSVDPNGTSPLIFAIITGHTEVAKLLYLKGASISHKDNMGKSALEYAKSLNRKELISLFKSNENEKNSK